MKFYITTPIYYVNDKPHIGSAYTTIAADVLARLSRSKGENTYLLTGVAEHGTKIATSAEVAGKEPQQFVDENSKYFVDAWKTLDISYDDFIRTTEQRHTDAVRAFFLKLKESGKLYEADYKGLYCVGHEAFIKESELDEKGNCPDHGKPPEIIKENNWFFKLSAYEEFLREKIKSGSLQIEPVERRNEILSLIDQGLEDIAISRRTAKFALLLPWDEEQTIYVWLDELFNYCSAIGYGADEKKFNTYWPADVHIVGKDIIKFHCVIWPAILDAIGEQIPKKVFAHGFFTVNGKKMSKSLGNVVDPITVAQEYGSDAMRYYLLRDIPFGNDGDFSHERLKDRYNADLANGLGNLVSRTLNMIEQFAPSLEFSGEVQVPVEPASFLRSVEEMTHSLSFDKALTQIWKAINWADNLIEKTKPWELAKTGDRKTIENILTRLYATLVGVNSALAPYMPHTHEKLSELLAARPIRKPADPLFARK